MLIASYLLGYDDKGNVNHLGVDHVFPRVIDGACFELHKIVEDGRVRIYDLLIFFPQGEEPKDMLCLPDLPEAAVAVLLHDIPLPVVDFACGRNVRVVLDSSKPAQHKRDCA